MSRLNQVEVLRVLDVNFNRAAEGLRTLEDVARVVRYDGAAAGWIKSLRHELANLAGGLPRDQRLAARAVHSDVGTGLTSREERTREDWDALGVAASERVTQSLRVIEEVSKKHFPGISADCKKLRYRAYDRLSQIERLLSRPDLRFPAPDLYVLVDCSLPLESFVVRIKALAEAGVGLFQIRDKTAEAIQLLQFSRAAVDAVGGERVIVNDCVDIALACGARGVHVGQDDLPIESVQAISGGRLWIGVSTHNIEQARTAQLAGADSIGCGPTFPSPTKDFEHFAGIEFLNQVAKEIELPAYAIGGIAPDNVGHVVATGIGRIAVSSAVWLASNPVAEAKRLLDALRSTELAQSPEV